MFISELFSRPSPRERRYRAAMAMLTALSHRDVVDMGIKPADFPRIARQMSEA